MQRTLCQSTSPARSLQRLNMPSTPEPLTVSEASAAAPPAFSQSSTKPRLRLRKRTTSSLSAPTQQFLASVAAADVPIPSIEEPSVLSQDTIDSAFPSLSSRIDSDHLLHSKQARTCSPPKTPCPDGAVPLLEPHQFPDWSLDSCISSLESSPGYESSRPSSPRSTQTSSSFFSRYSNASELSQCVSPESECTDRFGTFLTADDANAVRPRVTSARARKAPWTRSMSQHLWSIYMMYLQDPKVTPFTIGKSGIPPNGVCLRVAREARRSWRRPKPVTQGSRSQSTTPTAEKPRPAIQWPHTHAATRGHLRELCKISAGSSTRNQRYMANSPTPFGRTVSRYWSRRSAPPKQQQSRRRQQQQPPPQQPQQPPSKQKPLQQEPPKQDEQKQEKHDQHKARQSVFSASDLSMSLSMSISESMQLQGPLAQLTGSRSHSGAVTSLDKEPASLLPAFAPQRSSFVVKSCGPSVSGRVEDPFFLGDEPVRQNKTAGAHRSLGPAARLVESKPSSQKRRQAVLEPRRRKRPSLGTDFWTDPSEKHCSGHGTLHGSRSLGEFSSASSSEVRPGAGAGTGASVPCINIEKLFEASRPSLHEADAPGDSATTQSTLPRDVPTCTAAGRLGSPFVVTNVSQSFPNRFSSPALMETNVAAAGRHWWATVQEAAESSTRPSLATRLAYIDDRLRKFKQEDKGVRRSQSPQ